MDTRYIFEKTDEMLYIIINLNIFSTHIFKESNVSYMYVRYKICARTNRRGFADTIRT